MVHQYISTTYQVNKKFDFYIRNQVFKFIKAELFSWQSEVTKYKFLPIFFKPFPLDYFLFQSFYFYLQLIKVSKKGTFILTDIDINAKKNKDKLICCNEFIQCHLRCLKDVYRTKCDKQTQIV